MRITIESTASEPKYSVKSAVEVPFDDVDIYEVKDLIHQALQGYGFEDRDEDSDE